MCELSSLASSALLCVRFLRRFITFRQRCRNSHLERYRQYAARRYRSWSVASFRDKILLVPWLVGATAEGIHALVGRDDVAGERARWRRARGLGKAYRIRRALALRARPPVPPILQTTGESCAIEV